MPCRMRPPRPVFRRDVRPLQVEPRDAAGQFGVLLQRPGQRGEPVPDGLEAAGDDQIFVVLKIARLENDAIKYGEIGTFVSGRHIITVRHAADSGHAHAHGRFQSGPKLTQVRPDFILHGILDFVVNLAPIAAVLLWTVLWLELRANRTGRGGLWGGEGRF